MALRRREYLVFLSAAKGLLLHGNAECRIPPAVILSAAKDLLFLRQIKNRSFGYASG